MADATAANSQLVRMPNGDVVAFPADMPADEIGALIKHKFPKEIAAAGKPVPGNGGTSNPNDPFFQGLALPDRPDPAHTVQPGEESTGFLAPVSHNRRTGDWSLAVPGILTGVRDSILNAVQLPGDVAAGKYPEMNPAVSKDQLSPDLIGRGLNAAATIMPDAAPAALNVPGAGNALKAPGADAAAGLGIPLTRGQATGAIPALTKEESLRNAGGIAQNVIRNFDTTQKEAIAGAGGRIGENLGANPQNMHDLVVGALQDKVAFSKDQAASLYEIAADGGIRVKPEMVGALPQVMEHSLESSAVHVDQNLTPTAQAALNIIEGDTSKMVGSLPTSDVMGPRPASQTSISLDTIEQMRKKLVNLGTGQNDTDSRAMKVVMGTFGDWLQSAVDNMLVTGDDTALEALKKARSVSSDYLSITNPDSGDTAGKLVAKMAKGSATAEEVANWLYGANAVSPSLGAPHVAERVKSLVGDNSDAFNSVRASLWTRMTQDMASGDPLAPAKVARNIETFLHAKGTSLANVLYTPEEQAQMQQYADALKATAMPAEAANPSKAKLTVAAIVNGGIKIAAALAGAKAGGPVGAAAGFLSVPVFKSIGNTRSAMRAVAGAGTADAPITATAGRAMLAPGPTNALQSTASGVQGNRLNSVPLSQTLGHGVGARLVA